MQKNNEYDYIILGAGSAGCVPANELSQDSTNQVLILEAGPIDHKLMSHMPAGVHVAFKYPGINWNYDSESEPELQNRKITLPRGKVIGGFSSINSMLYVRGNPKDYDYWASNHKLDKWTYFQCLPYFKKVVGNEMLVHGLEGLRMVDFILGRKPLPEFHASFHNDRS